MKRLIFTSLLTLVLFVAGVESIQAGKHNLTFKTEDYCAATWNANTNTFTWGSGGSNSAWVFMAANDVSGDLSYWTKLHLHVSDWTNASAKQLTVVFKMDDGSWPPNGPTKEFVVSPDESGDIDLSLEGVNWGDCDITKIQDLTIYGCARDDNSIDASVVVTDAYYIIEVKNYLTFTTPYYCAATWDADTNTFTWGSGGSNSEWVFMAANDVSGDLSSWTKLHLHVSDWTNASAKQLTVVFKMDDGSWPPNGPTKEFVVSPDESGDIDLSLEGVNWGDCDITKIQDLTIYGCARDDNTVDASVMVTDAYYIETESFNQINQSMSINVNGTTRTYRLYVPNGCKTGAPLVIAMHGAGGSSDNQCPHFNEIADTAKFIIAYPQGAPQYFAIFGGTVTGWDATGEVNADVAFVKAIVNELYQNYEIDLNRVYCCGFSNGGMNTYALANACSDVFAAFASISGFPLNEFHLRHVGKRPVPFLHIHGKNDDFVKYSCMPTIVDEMVARMGANPVPVKTIVNGSYTKSVYEATDGSFPFIYYEIDGMGHNDFTNNTEDGNSSLTMWNHFRRYTLDMPHSTTLKWMPRIETSGFYPANHGWTVNSGTTLLSFGLGEQTNENNKVNNVYHSLQLTNGHYMLSFRADGTAGKTVDVKLEQYQTNAVVLNETVAVGEDVTLFFDIENDDFGQYKITFSRQNTTDNITISNIVLLSVDLVLDNDSDNTSVINTNNDKKASVVLKGRTLYKDKSWNSLCLPFDVTVSGSVLDGAIVKTLSSTEFAHGTLTMNFTDGSLAEMEAGVPYIIMWNDGDDIINPVFEDVTIKDTTNAVQTDYTTFEGSFSPVVYEEANNSVLYLGDNNSLYYPNQAMTIGAFRSRFTLLNGLVASENESQPSALSFVMNFDGQSTAVDRISYHPDLSDKADQSDNWFTLDGRRLYGKPTQHGLYLHIQNGKKYLIHWRK